MRGFVNDEAQTAVSPELLERAFAKSVVRGEAVFYELLRRESKLAGEWDYVEGFRLAEVLDAPADAAILRSLRRWLMDRG